MGDTYTRDELVAAYPLGTVFTQIDDETRALTEDEWNEWIDAQAGQPKDPFG